MEEVPMRCHCRLWPPLLIPSSSLPLKSSACYCKSCRLTTGAPALFCCQLPRSSWPCDPRRPDELGLRAYKTSETLVRAFCPNCGAHLFANEIGGDGEEWTFEFTTGSVAAYVAGGGARRRTTRLSRHIFVQPEDDGSLARFFTDTDTDTDTDPADAAVVPRYSAGAGSPFAPPSPDLTRPTPQPDLLPLRCHCGAWRATLRKPTEDESAPGALPDHAEVRGGKWRLSICVCQDCRLASGVPVSAMAHVTSAALVTSPPAGPDGALSTYRSSPGAVRSFCARCGASAFLDREGDPACRNVHIALADVPLATVLRHWVWGSERIAFAEEGEDKELTASLVEGWAAARR